MKHTEKELFVDCAPPKVIVSGQHAWWLGVEALKVNEENEQNQLRREANNATSFVRQTRIYYSEERFWQYLIAILRQPVSGQQYSRSESLRALRFCKTVFLSLRSSLRYRDGSRSFSLCCFNPFSSYFALWACVGLFSASLVLSPFAPLQYPTKVSFRLLHFCS